MILLLVISCTSTNQSIIIEKQELEKALHITQEIHMYHSNYLYAKEMHLKERYAKHLLFTLKNLDTLDYINSPLELTYQFTVDTLYTEIKNVIFGSGLWGIAWIVQFDSTLNEVNEKHKIIDLNELTEKSEQYNQ
jgi:hypothetical protein